VRAHVLVARLLSQRLPALELVVHLVATTEVRGGVETGRHALERVGEDSKGVGGGLGVDDESLPADVVEVVALLVVAGVPWGAVSGEEADGRDSELDEASVIGAAVEFRVLDFLALGDDVVLEELDTNAAVLVTRDLILGGNGRNHVVVEVELDLVRLLGGQVLSVVVRADQTGLLSSPPSEADLVGEAIVLLDGAHDLEEGSGSTAVVVDSRTVEHTVEMGTEHDDVVGVALLGLGDDVPRLALIGDGVDDQVGREGLSSTEAGNPTLGNLQRNNTDWHELTNVLGAEGGGGNVSSGSLVVEDDTWELTC